MIFLDMVSLHSPGCPRTLRHLEPLEYHTQQLKKIIVIYAVCLSVCTFSLEEDSSQVPNTNMVAYSCLNSSSRASEAHCLS